MLVTRRDAVSQDIEIRLVAPVVPVADDIKTTLGASDGHVEQIGLSGREAMCARPVRIAAEDEDDDIGFLALHGMHGADPLLPIPSAYLGEDGFVHLHGLAGNHAERADDPNLGGCYPGITQLGEH